MNKKKEQFRLDVGVIGLLEALAIDYKEKGRSYKGKKKITKTDVVEIAILSLATEAFTIEQRKEIIANKITEIAMKEREDDLS